MTARSVPVMPNFFAGQKLTGTVMNLIGTYTTFWANPPSFRMTQSVAQSILNATWAQVTCDLLDYDSDTGRQGTTPYSYVIPTGMTGRWQFGWQIPWANNATGTRNSGLRKNGSAISGYTTYLPAAGSGSGGAGWTDPIGVNAGDSMSIWAFQSSGSALSTAVAVDSFAVFYGRLVSLGNP